MRRFRYGLMAALLCLAMVGLGITPSHALPPEGDGYVAFQGTAELDSYPCPNTCSAEFNGSSFGTFSGVVNNRPWTVTWALASMFTTSIAYADSCALPVGLATGSGNMAVGVGGVQGTYGPTIGSTALPANVVQISAPFDFAWRRIGTVAIITATLDLHLKVTAPGNTFEDVTVMVDEPAVALAAFAPTGAPHDCTSPGPLGAIVAGTAAA